MLVLDEVSKQVRRGADDFVLTRYSRQVVEEWFVRGKEAVEIKDLRVNIGKTQLTMSGLEWSNRCITHTTGQKPLRCVW